MSEAIRVRGARVHNLQSVDADFPHGRLIVVSGPSGSGKSSLVFDTVFAEGRRQYLETLSLRARQLFRQLQRPDVDLIDGLQPTICIDQFPVARNPRGTVGTLTEVHDYLRVLFARAGTPVCPNCHVPIARYSLEEIQAELMAFPDETRLVLLAPHARGQEDAADLIADFRRRGFLRARINGELIELDDFDEAQHEAVFDVDLVVDRIIVRPGVEKRLGESLRLAAENPLDQVIVLYRGRRDSDWQEQRFSTRYACAECGLSLPGIEPRHFNPASPIGACPECEGLGQRATYLLDDVLADPSQPLAEQPFAEAAPNVLAAANQFLKKLHLDPASPVRSFNESTRRKLWSGCGRPKFAGLQVLLNQELATTLDRRQLARMEALRSTTACSSCEGSGLGVVGRAVQLGDLTLGSLMRMTVADAKNRLEALRLPGHRREIWERVMEPLLHRLHFLCQVGVEYLALGRRADTLSGGELQRIRLANAIGTSLAGVCYILDEPSIGLHARDNARLMRALERLRDEGNTVIVVEHDLSIIRAADIVIDVGPGAGPAGGHVIVQGSTSEVAAHPESPTGAYLRGERAVSVPVARRGFDPDRVLRIEGVSTHNLQNIDVEIPLGRLVCVTGVSGSGKSSLIDGTLVPALRQAKGSRSARPGPYQRLVGAERIQQIIAVDQSPIGRSPRSNPATYSGIFDEIRKVFARTRGARQRGFTAQRFSFNATAGRCEGCAGYGVKKVEMGVLADLTVVCDQCGGRRYNRQTLEVRYRHKTIADVLDMPVEEAREFFASLEKIHRPLQCLQDVGLGYLKLGQPADTLSGGESQRVKLATELARAATGSALYLLDEPTTGLHIADIATLLDIFQRLTTAGHTVLVVEHQMDVIKTADWVIDIGPGAGSEGGRIVAAGTPEAIAECESSYTGQFLREELVATR